jgi:hypothetical protein
MKQIKTLGAVFCAVAALCGCWQQEDPNKIYTIVLDDGKILRTLKIPGAYLPDKHNKNNSIGVWVQFSYPSMKPTLSRTPSENSIELLITLIFDVDKPSMSEFNLTRLKEYCKHPIAKKRTYHLGKIGIYDVYDVYEGWHSNRRYLTKTYFRRDKNGSLIRIHEVPGLRTSSEKRYANSLELNYGYSQKLMPIETEIDDAVSKLVDSWLLK